MGPHPLNGCCDRLWIAATKSYPQTSLDVAFRHYARGVLAMDVKYQVFVSSTYTDLIEERRSVIETILNMGHIPVGMEAFQASDDTQWDYIKRRIDESDYYVLIVAERYGSELDGKSYTQMEYEYAIAQGVPVAAFLLDGSARASWPANKVEYDKKEKVEQFRALCQQKLVKHWRNPDDLGGKVSLALNELIRHSPRVGWVRASSVPSLQVLEEVSRLSEERRRLQSEVERLSVAEESVIIPAEARWKIKELSTTRINDICVKHSCPVRTDSTLLDMLMSAASALTSGESIWSFQYSVWNHIRGTPETLANEPNFDEVYNEIISSLTLLDVIETAVIQRYSFEKPSTNEFYHLTESGKKLIMYVKILEAETANASK